MARKSKTQNGKQNSSKEPSAPGTVEVRAEVDRWQVVNGTKGGKEIHVKLVVANSVQNRMALAKMDDDSGVNVIGLQLDLEALAARQDEPDGETDEEWEDPNQTRLPVEEETAA